MDDNVNVLEQTLPDIQGKEVEGNNSEIDVEIPWDSCATTPGDKEVAAPSSNGSSEVRAHTGENSDTNVGRLNFEDIHKQSEEGVKFEADNVLSPSVKDTLNVNSDDEVVDVSPNGFSLATLDSVAGHKSQEILRVRNMYVYDNRFTVLPRSLSRLKNLRTLKVFSNEVRLLPDEVGDLEKLEHLQMKVCPSGLGSLPSLGNLNRLKTLELHQTPLRPSVFSLPPEISKLHLLTRLAVCNFSISFLPPEIGDLKNLEELDISFNRLKTLPKEVSSLTALKHLRAENNKLMELPSGLASLPNLSLIDVAHNKLTSLVSLGLSAMTSLKELDAKFNKLQNTGEIPDWITCKLEGNPSSLGQLPSSSEDGVVDSELLPAVEGDDGSSHTPNSLCSKENAVQKKAVYGKNKQRWKRHDVLQLKARQERLNMSRKSKAESMEGTKDGVDDVMDRESTFIEGRPEGQNSGSLLDGDFHQKFMAGGGEVKGDKKRGLDCIGDVDANKIRLDDGARQDETSIVALQDNCGLQRSKKDVLSANTVTGFLEDGDYVPVKGGILFDSHSSRKVISGDRCKQPELEEETGQAFNFKSKEQLENALVSGRRKGGCSDRNPKPSKRRKSAQVFSEVSYTYRHQSLCAFADHLQDGFYDAGREYPFSSLEVLESEQPCFDSREVILVDRERDEELDVSANHFLTGLELAGRNVGDVEYYGLNAFQKAAILSLYVSDCFGGSDKTLNVTNARRAALGGSTGVPFVCSCSLGSRAAALSNLNESNKSFQGAIPTVHMLCEGAVRLLKMQRQSNVIPIGSLPYGVCRHRAILFKYLCDRASIPCELVRGYLDYVPHAWNVIQVNKGSSDVRMLVDACRPLDIREEKDPEYFCRYIPFMRLQLPSLETNKLSLVQREEILPVLHEEIGRGASGSIVRRCSLGSLNAAAKVHVFDQASEALYKEAVSRCLSELRILCSLGEHPHIVSFYGHQFSSISVDSHDSKQGTEALQFMIFMDYVQGCSLENVLARYAKEGRPYMPAKEAAYVAKAVAHALSFVHAKGILHRDIKSSNVLVHIEGDGGDGTRSVKLCDFDSAVPLSSSSSHTCYLAHRGIPPMEVCVGTPRWMAPEVFRAMYRQHPYGLEADIWSFGCLLLEMLTLQVPYAGLPEAQIHSHIQMGQRPQLPNEIKKLATTETCSTGDETKKSSSVSSQELRIINVLVRLFKSCTESSPQNRPTALEIYKDISMILDASQIDAGKNNPETEILELSTTLSPIKGSRLESSITGLDADKKQEDTQKSHESFVEGEKN